MEDEWLRGLGLGLTNHVGTERVRDVCLCLGCGGVGGVGGAGGVGVMDGWLDPGSVEGIVDVMTGSMDYLCRWQFQVYGYCAQRIPTHLR